MRSGATSPQVDDDVYLRLDRLPHAVQQWAGMHAGAPGCARRRRARAARRGSRAGAPAAGLLCSADALHPTAPLQTMWAA